MNQHSFAYKSVRIGRDEFPAFRFETETDQKSMGTERAQEPGHFVAVHFGHSIIDDEHLELVFFYQIERRCTAFTGTDMVPLELEQHTKAVSRCPVVVYDKDSRSTHAVRLILRRRLTFLAQLRSHQNP